MNPIDPKIEQIAQSIKHHRKLETDQLKGEKNFAVALSEVKHFGKDQKIWITTRENLGGFKLQKDITGHTQSTISGVKTTVTEDGPAVYKNSPLGGLLIRHSSGKHTFSSAIGEYEIEINSFTEYTPHHHKSEAIELTFRLGDQKSARFKNLAIILEGLAELDREIEEIEVLQQNISADSEELNQITQQLETAKKKKEELQSEAQNFIRKNAELRYQPILDPWQEEVKRSHIFDGTIAIDGGPGTGKTTSLIQRIKFLTDREAMLGQKTGDFASNGYLPDLSKAQSEALFNQKNNWAFFTPNELLKLFLKNSMIEEGLIASDSKVLIWKDFLKLLIRQYKLVNPEKDNPFIFLNKYVDQDFLPHEGEELLKVGKAFQKQFLDHLLSKLTRVISIDIDRFSWKNKALSIQNYIKKEDRSFSLEEIIRLYFNLQETYEQEVKDLTKELADLLKTSAARIIQLTQSNRDFKTQISSFSEDWKQNSKNTDETDEELEDEELEDNSADIQLFVFGKLKVLIKNMALSKFDSSVSISKKYREFLSLIKPVSDLETYSEFERIGQLAYFSKYFAQTSKGIVANVINEIPKVYKAFRKSEFDAQETFLNKEVLHHILIEDKSKKRIHPDEQSFLIYFINKMINLCYKVSKPKAELINHPYFQAYRENSIPVIGVDEATDFHLIDLLAIHSLGHQEISSVTFSGDLMQRLTTKGIRRWEDLELFFKDFSIKPLNVSYRQSPTLLELASKIYEKATGKEAEYISFSEPDPKEPKPLWFKSEKEEEKIDWISKRIQEIYIAYGNTIPSIAIFISATSPEIEEFAKKLRETDEMSDNGIQVRVSHDGQVLGTKNMVRIFPIEYIKGLEFEAVFFHNIHQLIERSVNHEMVMKNLYVGLSRATFYLGVTSKEYSEDFDFISSLFEKKALSWNLQTLKFTDD